MSTSFAPALAAVQPLRDRLELAAGKAGLTVMRRLTATYTGLRPGLVDGLAYLHRPGTGPAIVAIHGFGGDKETWLLVGAAAGPQAAAGAARPRRPRPVA